eukprot:gene4059-4401_t
MRGPLRSSARTAAAHASRVRTPWPAPRVTPPSKEAKRQLYVSTLPRLRAMAAACAQAQTTSALAQMMAAQVSFDKRNPPATFSAWGGDWGYPGAFVEWDPSRHAAQPLLYPAWMAVHRDPFDTVRRHPAHQPQQPEPLAPEAAPQA